MNTIDKTSYFLTKLNGMPKADAITYGYKRVCQDLIEAWKKMEDAINVLDVMMDGEDVFDESTDLLQLAWKVVDIHSKLDEKAIDFNNR